MVTVNVTSFEVSRKSDLSQSTSNKVLLFIKSDNLQYNTLGCWVDRLIDQASDGPSIILIDCK